MPLTLTLRQLTSIPVEVDSIRLENVRAQSADEVLRTTVHYGNRQEPLGEFFDAEGSARDGEIVWQGDCSKVKMIGAGLSEGRVRVEGDAGMHVGAEMSGGEIIVNGNVADWVGAQMSGGRIHVHGNAGHLVGAVYRGGRRGMTGGEIFIDGDAGNEVGHTMRRGLIAIGGRAGDAIGFAMLAGSMLIFGEAGMRPGAGMKRGTIGLLGTSDPPAVLPTFRYACTWQPVFLRVYLRHLTACGFAVPEDCFETPVRRYSGDFLESGKGELLIRA